MAIANWSTGLVGLSFVAVSIALSSATEKVHHALSDSSGIIQSPGYPSSYPENQNISWTIRVREGFRIVIYFTEFDLEDSYDEELGGACVYDFVQIKDGTFLNHKLCGSSHLHSFDAPRILQEFSSTTNELTLEFVSDYSNENPIPIGFVAHYREQDRDECHELKVKATQALEDWDTLLYCNQHCHNVPSSYYCSCDPGFKLHENHHTCTNDCAGKVLEAPSGEISTSRFPQKYSKLAECDWTIQQRKGISIELKFVDDFGIEEHQDEGCVYDWVLYEDDAGQRSDKFCGKQKPNSGDWIFTNSHTIKITFISDLTIEEAGFKIVYRTKRTRCLVSPKAPDYGLITSTIKEYEFEDMVTFECSDGYRLIGKKQMVCQSDGTWDAEVPTCEIKRCQRPTHIEAAKNGRIKENNFTLTYGSHITFLCYVWYEMTSGTSMWRCEDDEEWHEASSPVARNDNQNIPKCEPICGLKGNKKILEGTYNFGDTIPNVEDTEGSLLVTHIIEGKKAKEAEWPWIVFLDLKGIWGLKEEQAICAGSLLTPNTVVTAAHCTRLVVHSQIRVYAGVTDRLAKSHNTQVFSVSQVIEHENYSISSHFENDIAVLKLNATVKIGKYARPICLPRSKREKELPAKALSGEEGYETKGVIAGWGITEKHYTSSDLLKARIRPIAYKTCVEHFENDGDVRLKVSKNMLCGGSIEGGRDSCHGDSGGPYMFKDNAQGRWILNGIVSFGSSKRNCGNKTFGIYTNVAKYVSWLEPFLANT